MELAKAASMRARLDSVRYQRYLDVMSDDEEFTIPLPPPFPHPGAQRDVVFKWRADEEPGGKEHEDIMLRRVPREVAMRFRGSAGGRGLTHAQYLTALVDLHRRARELADGGDVGLRKALDELGLASVTV
jgi:hypothetical protein